jgi:hypothetical protein
MHDELARLLRRKFWKSALMVVGAVCLVLLFQHIRKDGLSLTDGDWLRIAAVVLALTAALGVVGGWAIQSWKGNTVVKRIDGGLYVVEQLGAAALLIFALTL